MVAGNELRHLFFYSTELVRCCAARRAPLSRLDLTQGLAMVMSSSSAFSLRRRGLPKHAPSPLSYQEQLLFVCVCVRACVCVCAVIKLHLTAQSGPDVPVIICHSHRSSQGGIYDTCVCVFVFIKLHITVQSGPVILFILWHSH